MIKKILVIILSIGFLFGIVSSLRGGSNFNFQSYINNLSNSVSRPPSLPNFKGTQCLSSYIGELPYEPIPYSCVNPNTVYYIDNVMYYGVKSPYYSLMGENCVRASQYDSYNSFSDNSNVLLDSYYTWFKPPNGIIDWVILIFQLLSWPFKFIFWLIQTVFIIFGGIFV